MVACVVVLLLVYLVVGGVVFQLLETHPVPSHQLQPITENCLAHLWTITERLNVLYEKNWTRLVDEQLRQFELKIVEAMRHQQTNQAEVHWSFATSLLYSLTIITTIGFGNLGPKTVEGKIATMIYAVVGVPLMLLCLSHLGYLLADMLRFIYSQLIRSSCLRWCCCGCSSRARYRDERVEMCEMRRGGRVQQHGMVVGLRGGCGRAVCRLTALEADGGLDQRETYLATTSLEEEEEDEDEENHRHHRGEARGTPSRVPLLWPKRNSDSSKSPPSPPPNVDDTEAATDPSKARVPHALTLSILAGYLALGGWLVARSHPGTSYLEALFAVFTAVATISLGDLASRPAHFHATLALALYLLLGLTLVAMAFSLAQDAIVAKAKAVTCPRKRPPPDSISLNDSELSV